MTTTRQMLCDTKANRTYLKRMRLMAAAHRRHARAADHDRRGGVFLRDRVASAPPPPERVSTPAIHWSFREAAE
jgi:hypothetical protein